MYLMYHHSNSHTMWTVNNKTHYVDALFFSTPVEMEEKS